MEAKGEKKPVSAREAALDAMMCVLEKKGREQLPLQDALARNKDLSEQDRSFMERLVKGTLEKLLTIDAILNKTSRIKANKMKPLIRNILRLAVYQILWMDAVPDSAAVNEAVAVTKKRGLLELSSFVNGVLRSITRNRERFSFPDRKEDPIRYLSVRYSVPNWIIKRFCATYGEAVTETIVSSLSSDGGVTVRVNLSRASVDEVAEELKEAGVTVKQDRYLPYALHLSGFSSLTVLPGFQEGHYAPQDVSSMLVGEVAKASPGMRVLDLCASPGGKSMHLLDQGACVIACDRTDGKTARIRENFERCRFEKAQILVNDAAVYRKEWEKSFDLVVADVPCSGLGVMGRKYDIRYRMTPAAINELVLVQKEILTNAVRYVRPGGHLLYSTCTIDRQENEEQVRGICEKGAFRPVDLRDRLPAQLLEDAKRSPGAAADIRNGRLQLLPGIFDCDGFFLSLLERKADHDTL